MYCLNIVHYMKKLLLGHKCLLCVLYWSPDHNSIILVTIIENATTLKMVEWTNWLLINPIQKWNSYLMYDRIVYSPSKTLNWSWKMKKTLKYIMLRIHCYQGDMNLKNTLIRSVINHTRKTNKYPCLTITLFQDLANII